jgi:hypothetical protein
MSLTTTKTYNIGIISSKGLDDPDFLQELIGDNIKFIEHIYTNGVNKLVLDFAHNNGIPYTIFPLVNKNIFWSTAKILENVEFVYLISSPESQSTTKIYEECLKKKIKTKIIPYVPYTHWQQKVEEFGKVMAAIPKEEIENSVILKTLEKII